MVDGIYNKRFTWHFTFINKYYYKYFWFKLNPNLTFEPSIIWEKNKHGY